MDNAADQARTPGILLLVVGILHLVYYLGSTGWGLFGLLMGGFGVVLQLIATMDNTDNLFGAIMSIWGVLVSLVKTVVYAVLILTSGLVIRGGISLQGLSHAGRARTGAMLAIGGPLVGLLAGLLGLLSCQCGALCGVIPDFLMLLLGGGAGAYAISTINAPHVAEAFAE